MGAMVSHRSSVYMDMDEAMDAFHLAQAMVAPDSPERPMWDGVAICLATIINFNSGSGEEFIANAAQTMDRYGE